MNKIFYKRKIFALLTPFLTVAIVFVWCIACVSLSTAQEKEAAPGFSLKGLNGEIKRLEDYRGKLILLNFWATWCPPCREEMPSLEKLYRSLKDRGFVILGISSDIAGKKAVKPFVEEFKLTFPILLDPDSKVTNLYMVRARPTSYLVNPQGYLITRWLGPRDWMEEKLFKSIESLLPAEGNP